MDMQKFISIVDDAHMPEFEHIVEELKKLGCIALDKHKLIGVIAGESPVPLDTIKIKGLSVNDDEPKQMIGNPEDEVQ